MFLTDFHRVAQYSSYDGILKSKKQNQSIYILFMEKSFISCLAKAIPPLKKLKAEGNTFYYVISPLQHINVFLYHTRKPVLSRINQEKEKIVIIDLIFFLQLFYLMRHFIVNGSTYSVIKA